jgi:acyl carrier protein
MGGRRDKGRGTHLTQSAKRKIKRGIDMEIKARIKETLVSLLKVKPEELKDEVSLQDSIGVDSTEMVEAVIALEKAFNVKLSTKEISKFSSLNDIERIIQGRAA